MAANLTEVEELMGKKFGDPKNPLLVSVRSGARASMPGMMDTILNLGLNDVTVQGIIAQSRDERFAYDAYRRFVQMYSDVVMGMDKEILEHLLEQKKEAKGVHLDTDLTADDWKDLVAEFKAEIKKTPGQGFPGRSPGTAVGRHRRGIRLVDEPARHHLPQAEQHPGRLGDRRQRPVNGVRQHG